MSDDIFICGIASIFKQNINVYSHFYKDTHLVLTTHTIWLVITGKNRLVFAPVSSNLQTWLSQLSNLANYYTR